MNSAKIIPFEDKKGSFLPKPSRKGFITNYPPVRQWKSTKYEEIRSGNPINVYVHIPFCIQRCAYCYYKTNELKKKGKYLDRYVNALCREIELASQYFHLKERPVVSIYFGGGTPTLLKEDHFQRLSDCLHANLNISTPEFTVEGEPVTFTQKKGDLLKSLGVNRISLGVQSFSDEILRICNRLDNEEKVLRAIDIAQETGAIVNIDLLSGLAGETSETWAHTIDSALSSGAESITVYKMELYANTEYFKKLRKQEIELPSDGQETEFMRYALDQFETARYLPWCFFTFTKNGHYPHTYISSVWNGADCYGFGASAFGEMGPWLCQNTNDDEKYVTILESGKLPVNRSYQLTALEQMIRTVMLGMKLIRLDLKAFQRRFGFRLETLCADALDELEAGGFVTLTESEIVLTPKGMLYGDYAGKCLAKPLTDMKQ